MKKRLVFFLASAIILLLAVYVNSISRNNDETDISVFIGTWIGYDRNYQLFEDGSGILNVDFVNEPWDLEWKVRDNQFITIFSDGFEAEFEYEITAAELILRGVFGIEIYTRADE